MNDELRDFACETCGRSWSLPTRDNPGRGEAFYKLMQAALIHHSPEGGICAGHIGVAAYPSPQTRLEETIRDYLANQAVAEAGYDLGEMTRGLVAALSIPGEAWISSGERLPTIGELVEIECTEMFDRFKARRGAESWNLENGQTHNIQNSRWRPLSPQEALREKVVAFTKWRETWKGKIENDDHWFIRGVEYAGGELLKMMSEPSRQPSSETDNAEAMASSMRAADDQRRVAAREKIKKVFGDLLRSHSWYTAREYARDTTYNNQSAGYQEEKAAMDLFIALYGADAFDAAIKLRQPPAAESRCPEKNGANWQKWRSCR